MSPFFWWQTRAPQDAAHDIVRLLLDADLPSGGFASRTWLFDHDEFIEDTDRQDGIMVLAEDLLRRAGAASAST